MAADGRGLAKSIRRTRHTSGPRRTCASCKPWCEPETGREDHDFPQPRGPTPLAVALGSGHPSYAERLRQLNIELANLSENLALGLATPTVIRMITDREAEKTNLEAHSRLQPLAPKLTILPDHTLKALFEEKVAALRANLDDDAVRGKAAQIISRLIESVTIYPEGPNGPEAEVVAKLSDLIAFATNDNAAPKGGDRCSMAVVAGTGFEPVTFRL